MFRVTLWKMVVRSFAAIVAIFVLATGAVYAGNFVYDQQVKQREWRDNLYSQNAVPLSNPLDNVLFFDNLNERADGYYDFYVPILPSDLDKLSPGMAHMVSQIAELDDVRSITVEPFSILVLHESDADRQKLYEQIEDILDGQYL